MQACNCVLQSCAAIKTPLFFVVHWAPCAHLDSDCFFRSSDALKLVDFGLAKPYGEVQSETQRYANSKKSSNTRGVGTPSYAAPEQLSGGEVSAAADMVSIDCINNISKT